MSIHLYGVFMKKIIALTIITFTAFSAQAHQRASHSTPSWTGFYLGVNGGYGWGQENVGDVAFYSDAILAEKLDGSTILTDASPDFNGGFGGGQVGYNYAFEKMALIGIEADIQGAGFDADYRSNNSGLYGNFAGNTEMNWFGTVRARGGFFIQDVLVYATGGFAYGAEELTLNDYYTENLAETITSSDSQMRTGWVAGAGLEAAIYRNLTARAEYLYISFSSETFDLNETPTTNTPSVWSTINVDVDNTINTFRLGLSYNF